MDGSPDIDMETEHQIGCLIKLREAALTERIVNLNKNGQLLDIVDDEDSNQETTNNRDPAQAMARKNINTMMLIMKKNKFTKPSAQAFCKCRGPEVGKMVACDNAECEIEWYHFQCVGLAIEDVLPDKWFCPACRSPEKKNQQLRPK